jgi:hypothetical protein
MGETPETVSVMLGHSSAHSDASPRYTESPIGLSCSRNAQHVADALEVAGQEDRLTYETGRQRTS